MKKDRRIRIVSGIAAVLVICGAALSFAACASDTTETGGAAETVEAAETARAEETGGSAETTKAEETAGAAETGKTSEMTNVAETTGSAGTDKATGTDNTTGTADAAETDKASETTKSTKTAGEGSEAGYEFKSGETVIAMGAEAADILKALGDPSSSFERDSCAYQGKNKVYTYAGFELSTYPVGQTDCVESVYILDATVATPEGIKIGSTKDEVLAVYGEEYDAEEAGFGTYSYTAGNSQLKIYTTKDVVDAIEYLVIPEK